MAWEIRSTALNNCADNFSLEGYHDSTGKIACRCFKIIYTGQNYLIHFPNFTNVDLFQYYYDILIILRFLTIQIL